MRRVIGFGLFWVAGGMVINMLIDSLFAQILVVLLCILIGYRLYCCK